MNDVIKCDSAALVRALKLMNTISRGKDNLDILKCVLVEYRKGEVIFTAASTDQQISRKAAMDVKGSGVIAIDAAKLVAIAGALPDGSQAVMEIGDKAVVLKAGRSRYTFQTMDPSIFPRLPAPAADAPTIELGDEFRRALEGTRHAHSANEVQWHVCCAALHSRDGMLEVFSTDTNRMAVWQVGAFDVPDKLLPTAAVDLILAADNDQAIEISIGENVVWLDFGDTLIGSKVLDAKIQPYWRIMGFDPAINVAIDRKVMIQALARLLLVSDDKDRSVIVEIAKNTLVMSNTYGREEMPCDASGELRIGFRAAHLKESLSALDHDDITLAMTTPTGPVRVTSADQPEATIVIMPYRLASAEVVAAANKEKIDA